MRLAHDGKVVNLDGELSVGLDYELTKAEVKTGAEVVIADLGNGTSLHLSIEDAYALAIKLWNAAGMVVPDAPVKHTT